MSLAVFLLLAKITNAQSTQLWGMCTSGGANNQYGYLFKMNLDGSNFVNMYPLSWAHGADPKGGLIQHPNGSIYGMTESGGAYGEGVLFIFNGYHLVVHDFGFGPWDPASPRGKLLAASNGILYGVTPKGGGQFNGTLFCLNPNGGQVTKIRDFNLNNANGIGPCGSLMQASNGLIYGTSFNGGYNGYGFVFSFNPVNNAYNEYSLNSLWSGASGKYPESTLVQKGNYLYGTTTKGGTCNKGTVFKFNMTTHSVSDVMEFCGNQSDYGDFPTGLLTVTSAGDFYGTTHGGGASGTSNNDGVLFKFTNYSSAQTTPVYFDGTNKGSAPHGGMLSASDGNFYGTTTAGGAHSTGTIFRFNPATNSFLKIYDFFGGKCYGELLEIPCSPVAVYPGNITSSGGIPKVCPGETRTYAVTAVAGLTYNWSAFPGATITSGQGSSSITVSFSNAFVASSGSLKVIATNGICTSAASYKAIYKNIPDQPGAISVSGGAAAVCPGDNRSYSVPLVVSGTTLNWTGFTGLNITGGQGTSTITTNFTSAFTASTGTLTVTATNSCGTTTPTSLVISRNSPVQPGNISGSSTVCSGQYSQYAISAVSNATSYSWTWPTGATASLGAGGTSIMVHFGSTGGNVTVQSYNACGFSASKTRSITVSCRDGEDKTVPQNNFEVSPNPTNGLTVVKLTLPESQICELILSDLSGRIVKSNKVNGTKGLQEYELDMRNLTEGIYLLRISTPGSESFKRISKN